MKDIDYLKIYKIQLEGRKFKMNANRHLFIFGPAPNDTPIIIRSSQLADESNYTPKEVIENILNLNWILE